MIFDSNRTSLGSSIPMAEGYDCSYGPALALIESARNDMAVFKAMLDSDAYECQIRRESTGSVMESEIASLNEAVGSGIWSKIKELFAKLVAKVKAIFHSFIAKIDGLFKKDKELAKKYGPEIKRKGNIGNLEVKWRKEKTGGGVKNFIEAMKVKDTYLNLAEKIVGDIYAGDKNPDSEEQLKAVTKEVAGKEYDSLSEMKSDFIEGAFEDEDTLKISEIGGPYGIINYMETCEKNTKEAEGLMKDITKAGENAVKEADKSANEAAKGDDKDATTKAQRIYTISVKIQDVVLALIDVYKELLTINHKQNKAAFMKMVAANDKKLEENALYLDMIAEAAEDQVDDVINSAIDSKGTELSELNNASRNVLDGSESTDPNEFTYAKDPDYKPATVDGSVETDYVSRESAIFDALLY